MLSLSMTFFLLSYSMAQTLPLSVNGLPAISQAGVNAVVIENAHSDNFLSMELNGQMYGLFKTTDGIFTYRNDKMLILKDPETNILTINGEQYLVEEKKKVSFILHKGQLYEARKLDNGSIELKSATGSSYSNPTTGEITLGHQTFYISLDKRNNLKITPKDVKQTVAKHVLSTQSFKGNGGNFIQGQSQP